MENKTVHSPLLEKYINPLKQLNSSLPILDLACGAGRNGLFCLKHNLAITFADKNEALLKSIQQSVSNNVNVTQDVNYWQVDFELENTNHLPVEAYSCILVYRYLHRPLFTQIKQAVMPRGLIIYETFIRAQAEFGRPTNPAFLLAENELKQAFSDWEILHYFEGIKISETGGKEQAIAQIVARKC